MKQFIKLLFSIFDESDKKRFFVYLLVLFFGSIFAVLGIGAMIPFISVLIQPQKIMAFQLFHGMQYNHVVLLLTIVLIAAFAIKNLISFLLLLYQSRFLFSLVAKIQRKLFLGYMSLPYQYHLYRSTPELIKIINNETTMLTSYVISPMGIFLTELLSSFFIVIVLLLLNPFFTIFVVLALAVAIALFNRLIRSRISMHAKARATSWSAMTKVVLMGLSGIKESKLYHCEDVFIDDFNRESHVLKSATAFQISFQQAPRMLIEFVGLTVVMSVLCVFVFLGDSPKELFVLLGVFGVASAQLLPSMNRLTQSLVQMRYGTPALKTLSEELMQMSSRHVEMLKAKSSLNKAEFNEEIHFDKVCYSYDNVKLALNDINITFEKGKRIAIVGQSGAGKTTLVDLLMGLYHPASGEISIDGKALQSDADFLAFQKLFAYIPQQIILFDKTIEENIAYGVAKGDIDKSLVWSCLQDAQLREFVELLPEKEHTMIGESGVRLSGGQRQRLGIARALYRQPEILVMDEATSALDNQTEKGVTDVLSLLQGLTIVTIAHRLTTIQDYDIVFVMKDGKVIAKGGYKELKENCSDFMVMIRSAQNDK